MIVELVGPPGAGKTTIAGALDQIARAADQPVLPFDEYQALDRSLGEAAIMKKPRLARWATLAPLCWRDPRLVWTLAILVLLHGRPLLRRSRKAQRVAAHVLFHERLAARHPDRVCIHHDGFTQCLWSMLIDSRGLRGRGLIGSLLRAHYARTGTGIVILEVSDTDVKARVFGRVSKGRFNRDSSPERRAEFGRWLEYHRRLVEELPEARTLARIDATAAPDEVAAEVLQKVSSGHSRG